MGLLPAFKCCLFSSFKSWSPGPDIWTHRSLSGHKSKAAADIYFSQE